MAVHADLRAALADTAAIVIAPTAALYSNRAMCFVKRSLIEGRDEWREAAADCRACVHLEPEGRPASKALYNLGISLTKLGEFDEARSSLEAARRLLEAARQPDTASLGRLAAADDALRKAAWLADDEQQAVARQGTLERLRGLLEAQRPPDGDAAAAAEWHGHARQLEALAAEEEARRTQREVPDWLCCKITMDVVREPVITPDGICYEKGILLEHLAKSPTDPLTRQPLRPCANPAAGSSAPARADAWLHRDELRPNYALKEAATEFLERNPWALPDVMPA